MADDGSDCRYLADIAVKNQPQIAGRSGNWRWDFLQRRVPSRQAVRQDGEAEPGSRRANESGHIIGAKRELTAASDCSQPFMQGEVIPTFILPEEVPILRQAAIQVIL